MNESPSGLTKMPYDIFMHRHKFAVWAAARAVQRGWKEAKVSRLREAIEGCGVVEFIKDSASLSTNTEQFELLHRKWCKLIQDQLISKGIGASYGRVAKLLAVYLKAMVVIAALEETPLARAIHPPIDRQLLQTLARATHLSRFRQISFTQLERDQYYDLAQELRQLLDQAKPFWMLEEYWPVTDD